MLQYLLLLRVLLIHAHERFNDIGVKKLGAGFSPSRLRLEGDVSEDRTCSLFLGGPDGTTGISVKVRSDDGSDVSPLSLLGPALLLSETSCLLSFVVRGTKRYFSSTLSSPSRIGRRQSKSSFTSSFAAVEDSTSVGALPSRSLL